MICVAAAIVFGLLAIFSAKYRSLAKEAWSCVFRKVTLRPCQSGLDRRMRTGAMLMFAKRSPKLGRAVYKVFPAISFIFVALTIVSFVYLAWGGYNYALYGNCNGPGSTGFCVFDPAGPQSSETGQCTEHPSSPETLFVPTPDQYEGMKVFNPGGSKTVAFFGCYSCPYTREGFPALFEVISRRPDVSFVVIDFPLPTHEGSSLAANAANCVYDISPQAYLTYAKALYTVNLSQGLPNSEVADRSIPEFSSDEWLSYGIDFDEINSCALSEHARVKAGRELGTFVGIYGTPTYFINDKAYVGPLNRRALEKLIGR